MTRLAWILLRPAAPSEALALRVAVLALFIVLAAAVYERGQRRVVHVHVSAQQDGAR